MKMMFGLPPAAAVVASAVCSALVVRQAGYESAANPAPAVLKKSLRFMLVPFAADADNQPDNGCLVRIIIRGRRIQPQPQRQRRAAATPVGSG
jgi:hypothetical protein